MLAKLQKLKANDFVRHNAIFFTGSMAVSAVNYLYYPLVGRLVSTAEFGEVQALISISLQIALLLSILADVTVNVVANAKPGDNSDQLVVEFERLGTFVMGAVVLLAIIFVQPLKHFLHFNGELGFLVAGVALVINASSTLRSAYLRGRNAYGRLSVASLLSAITKLISSLVLVFIRLWHCWRSRRSAGSSDCNPCVHSHQC